MPKTAFWNALWLEREGGTWPNDTTSASTSTKLTVTEWSYCLFVGKKKIFRSSVTSSSQLPILLPFGIYLSLSVFAHFNFNSQQPPNQPPKVETAGMMTTEYRDTDDG